MSSPHKTRRRRALPLLTTCAAALLGASPLADACGPFFPNSVLSATDEQVLAMPVADFSIEIARLKLPPPEFRAVPPDKSPEQQTLEQDLKDLAQALTSAQIPAAQRERILREYSELRNSITAFTRHRRSFEAGWDKTPPAIDPRSIPTGLPPEFDDYARGLLAMCQDRLDEANTAWERLLARPAPQRRYRTVWAAYMLARYPRPGTADPELRARFARVRQLVREGWPDPLGLASASIGREAQLELRRGRHAQAIAMYLQEYAGGSESALASLQIAALQALKQPPEQLITLARDPAARQVLTASILAQGGRWQKAPDRASVQAFLAAVETAGVRDLDGASRLAWAAYDAGQFEMARRWLGAAPPQDPLALWVGSKLALRAGKIDQAIDMLARASKAFPVESLWNSRNFEDRADHGRMSGYDLTPGDTAATEAGALTLSRGRYVEALDHLLRGRAWMDAAYVAERVLSADELKAYVDRSWPASLAAPPATESESRATDGELASLIRHLLARRLAREQQWTDARPYFPKDHLPAFDNYVRALRQGADAKRARDDRARSLMEAARLARHQGMDLLGTELAPDNSAWGGSYGADDVGRPPQRPSAYLRPTPDELNRISAAPSQPEKRFHYRYLAADHAWAATQLMPDQSEETAKALCEAGSWLKGRDPQAADRFFKALVRRCGNTKLGREAQLLRWFPTDSSSDG